MKTRGVCFLAFCLKRQLPVYFKRLFPRIIYTYRNMSEIRLLLLIKKAFPIVVVDITYHELNIVPQSVRGFPYLNIWDGKMKACICWWLEEVFFAAFDIDITLRSSFESKFLREV